MVHAALQSCACGAARPPPGACSSAKLPMQLCQRAQLQRWLREGLHAHKPLLPDKGLHHLTPALGAGHAHGVGLLLDGQPSSLHSQLARSEAAATHTRQQPEPVGVSLASHSATGLLGHRLRKLNSVTKCRRGCGLLASLAAPGILALVQGVVYRTVASDSLVRASDDK